MDNKECCNNCKWYEQDNGDYEYGIDAYIACRATNNGNLKGFPFQNKLKCYEEKEENKYDIWVD